MDISKFSIPALSISFALITGCNSTPVITKTSDSGVYGSYMFTSPCTTQLSYIQEANFAETAAAIFATQAIKVGIDALGAAISKAAEDDIERTHLISNQNGIKAFANPDTAMCLHIVRSNLEYSSDDSGFADPGALSDAAFSPALLKIKGKPEVHIEVLPVVSGKTVAFIPLQVQYYGVTPKENKKQKARELALFIGYATPDKNVQSGDYPGRLINFGLLEAPKDDVAKLSFVKNGRIISANQTQFLDIDIDNEESKFSFAATIIETQRAGKMIKFLDAVFKASKEEIKTAAATAVAEHEIFKSKAALEQAKLDKISAENALRNDYYTAVQLVITKKAELETLCQKPSPTKAEIFKLKSELLNLVNDANVKKRKAKVADSDLKADTPNESC